MTHYLTGLYINTEINVRSCGALSRFFLFLEGQEAQLIVKRRQWIISIFILSTDVFVLTISLESSVNL